MAITDIDTFINALANNGQQFVINKASLSNAVIGQSFSLWTSTGIPAVGATPSTPEICAKGFVGGFLWDNPTGGNKTYLARTFIVPSIVNSDLEFHDRLAHMGGLSGSVTSPQTVDLDLTGSASNLTLRRGKSDYSQIQWWLEWYVATGVQARDITVTYTNGAGTSGRQVLISSVIVGATVRQGRMIEIIGIDNEPIRSVESIQLSATTAGAGNFGVTATRYLHGKNYGVVGVGYVADIFDTQLRRIENDACIFLIVRSSGGTTTGTFYGSAKIIQG